MTAEKKIAQKRLTLLQVAERIRNVSDACRRHSVSRSQFYEYKRAFQERGFDGLMDRPPIPKSFQNETPGDVKEKIIALSLKHPAWGPVKISDQLRLEGIAVSPSTVRNLWIKENLRRPSISACYAWRKRRTARIWTSPKSRSGFWRRPIPVSGSAG